MSTLDLTTRARRRLGALRTPSALERRLDRIEQEIAENRRLHRRVAELTDLVTELVVPLARRDDAEARAVLERYRSLI